MARVQTQRTIGLVLVPAVILVLAVGLYHIALRYKKTANTTPETTLENTTVVAPVVWQRHTNTTYNISLVHPPDFTLTSELERHIWIDYQWSVANPHTGIGIHVLQTDNAYVYAQDPYTYNASSIVPYQAGAFEGFELIGITHPLTPYYRKIYLNNNGSMLIVEVWFGSEEHPFAVSVYNQLVGQILDTMTSAY